MAHRKLTSEPQAARTSLKQQQSFWEEHDVHFGKVGDSLAELKLVAFIKPLGHQECKRVSFGVSSAPKAFERIIALLLEGFQEAEIRMNAVCNLD